MKRNIIYILVSYILLSTIIISVFVFFCDANQNLTNGVILSSILSLIMFFILFIFEKRIVTENIEKEEHLTKAIKKTKIDELTNLPNRESFFQNLDEAKGIILLDLDDFSILNGVYSKEVGDEFLKKLAYKLRGSRCINNLYRLGGDEFAYISKKEQDLKAVAECLLDIISKFYITKDNFLIQVTATLAITYKEPFIETADLALKFAKKNRLNIAIFSNRLGLFEDNQSFMDITLRIKKGLKSDSIVPFFQCITDKNKQVIMYESLMRIKEGEKYLTPSLFLDIAKKTKLYYELSLKMIEKSFEYMKDKEVPFSINLSFDDIINRRVYNFLFEKIEQFPKKENIIIELVETEAITNFDYVKNFIDKLHSLGVKVAIDDFGSGYSNFIYLEKLDVDFIKIDGEIIKTILLSDNSSFIVRTLVDFCNQNSITLIAEYVEHYEIFTYLKELGVELYQGFYFCKPKEKIE